MARRLLPTAVLAPVAIVILAAGVRLWGVTSPPSPYWDESHYVFDASAYLGGGLGADVDGGPPVRIADEGTWIHPPMGKWMIALLGVGPFGMEPLGWRLPSVIFGVIGVLLVYLIAKELWRSIAWASIAGGLLALDGLHIVQSRIGMLDIFLSTFVLAGTLFLVRDRNRMGTASETWPHLARVVGSPDRLLAGVFLGAAIACKWAGAFALVLALILSIAWTLQGRELGRRSKRASIGTIALSLLIVPTIAYLASYGAFWFQHGLAVSDFLTLQIRMFEYHQHHLKVQPENSRAWTWPLLLHPIQYFRGWVDGSQRLIVALGNPVIWWGFLALLPAAAVSVVRRPDWRNGVVFGSAFALFLPWLFVGRSQFLFYMLPVVPFMCLGIVSTLRGLGARTGPSMTWFVVGGAVVAAIAFLPLWTGIPVPGAWRNLLGWLPNWPH